MIRALLSFVSNVAAMDRLGLVQFLIGDGAD